MSDVENNQAGESFFIERRSGGDRRSRVERRSSLRWDPRNLDRRKGGDRRRPGYVTDNPGQSDTGASSDPEDQ